MKNIFKKNQIIITALAIMIAIAGYLSFTNNDKPDVKNSVETTSPDLEDAEAVSDLSGTDLTQATTDTTGNNTTTGTGTGTANVTGAASDTGATTGTTTDKTNGATTNENDETTPVKTTGNKGELGDISDDDILEAANDVSDTGELDIEDGVPGEAVLASTTIDAGYFITNKMEREQMRAKNKATYMEIIESPDVAEALKQDAIARTIELTDIAEKENATEILLEARGFDGALVSINEDKVDVIINAESISDQQLAIIEEVVKNKTDIPVTNMSIVPVIVEE